jgi:hypothetical protein
MARSQSDIDRGNNSEALIRAVIAFLVHLALAIVAVAVIYWMTKDFEDASELVRNTVGSDENAESGALAYLAEARADLLAWLLGSMLASWLASSLFLALAQRHEPRIDSEARKMFGLWGVLLILTLGLSALIWWRRVSLVEAGGMLISSNYITIIATGVVATFLGYYLVTGMAVKPTMKPSVPGASVLPSLRKGPSS